MAIDAFIKVTADGLYHIYYCFISLQDFEKLKIEFKQYNFWIQNVIINADIHDISYNDPNYFQRNDELVDELFENPETFESIEHDRNDNYLYLYFDISTEFDLDEESDFIELYFDKFYDIITRESTCYNNYGINYKLLPTIKSLINRKIIKLSDAVLDDFNNLYNKNYMIEMFETLKI